MTILSEIQKWAETLPVWQQHAVAMLYEWKTATKFYQIYSKRAFKCSCS